MKRLIFEHEQFPRPFQRSSPARSDRIRRNGAAGQVDRDVYRKAGEAGLLGFNVPEEFRRRRCRGFPVQCRGRRRTGPFSHAAPAFTLQNDVVVPYFTSLSNEEQRARWLPGMATGETIVAVAMTEPGAGSDLAGIKTSAVREGDDWILNGSKTFISSGINSDIVVVVCRTNRPGRQAQAFLAAGRRARHGRFPARPQARQDGPEVTGHRRLHFDNVRVPAANVLSQVDQGFYHLMHNRRPERLSIAVTATAIARSVYEETLRVLQRTAQGLRQTDRHVPGQPVHPRRDGHRTRRVAQAYIDRCLQGVLDGEASAVDVERPSGGAPN